MVKRKGIYFFLFVGLCLILLLQSCKKNPLKVDIKDIRVILEIERFEQKLFAIDTAKIQDEVDSLAKKHMPFFDNYTQKVIEIGDYRDSAFAGYLKLFLRDTIISQVFDTCQFVFPTMDKMEAILTKAFRYYKYYFPEKKIPRILTHISGFHQSIIVDEGIVSISLDKYLGTKNSFYRRLSIYNYQKVKMHPAQIPYDVFLALGISEVPVKKTTTLLDNIIHLGKIRYFVQAMFPAVDESKIMGYSEQQQKWCLINEAEMWAYIAENRHLFNTENRIIRRYIEEGPFTKGFPEGSPSQTGIWLGLQIVKAYVRENDESFTDLMKETDYEKILRNSGYKP